ncbi:MAG TPA: hypothetical protein VFD22_06475 [Gemmatimonadaceae bacterium]|nr:hypothetical protein [Gemmatimonadaceae bacterium]
MKKTIINAAIIAAIALAACSEPATSPVSSAVSIRAVRPTPPPSSNISVVSLGSLPYSVRRRSNDGIGLALNDGVSRSTTRVVGATSYDVIDQHAMTWTEQDGMSPLDFGAPVYGWAYAVSDNGIIAGSTSPGTGNRAFVAAATTAASYLPVPAGTTSSEARGISADGQCITGFAETAAGGFALLWRAGGFEVVGSGSAIAVSNDCLAVAGTNSDGAVVWRWNGSAWIAEPLPFVDAGRIYLNGRRASSEVNDLSPSGEYVAGARTDSLATHPVVWHRVGGSWIATDLPGTGSLANGVDNIGRAVGAGPDGPLLWTSSSSGYTRQILPPLERSNLGWASAINELGQITGRSRTRKGSRAVLWTIN